MLDWDKPLSAQHPEMQKALVPALERWYGKGNADYVINQTGKTGKDLLIEMGYDRKASQILTESGIPGIRYLDGGSRATGGTSNYVVFPGNEGLLSILERNGQAVK